MPGTTLLPGHEPSALLAAEPAAVSATQVGVTPPPMDWASWNSFAGSIDAIVVEQQTDALVSSGTAAAGYRYVNLDDGWWQGARNADGSIAVDASLWPGGMKAVADHIHGKGLKAGIYTDAATTTTVRWADLGLTTAAAPVRNVWTGGDAGSFGTSYTTTVPAGDAVASGTTYEDTTGSAAPTFTAVSASAAGTRLVDITYANGSTAAREATVQVNGQYASVVTFPPTGSAATYRTVSVLAHLARGTNTVRFAAVSGAGAPDVDAIRVQDVPGTNGTALVGAASGRCADAGNTITDATQAQLWGCSGGELVVYGNKCLDAAEAATADATKLILWTCNAQTNQKWTTPCPPPPTRRNTPAPIGYPV